MTIERQDITEDFYSGNTKDIGVQVYKQDGNNAILTGAEITYAVVEREDPYDMVILLNSTDSNEIEIDDGPNGHCIIHLLPKHSAFINGTFRHHMNVVDVDGDESTAFSGKLQIFRSFAKRPRKSSTSAFVTAA